MKMTDHREESLEARRAHLEAELAARRVKADEEEAQEASSESNRRGFAQGLKLSSEFISAIVVGAALGYFLDFVVDVGTKPWGMIFLLLLGFCAGVLNIMRSLGIVGKPGPGSKDKT